MATTSVGIREFKTQMSAYLRQVKQGKTLVITERGKPIAELTPARKSLAERRREMIAAGLVQWSGHKLKPRKPGPRVRGNKTMAQLLLEDRE